MGNRAREDLYKKYPHLYKKWYKLWCSPLIAKYAKRRLSKKRRYAWKDAHERGLAAAESTVKYRGW